MIYIDPPYNTGTTSSTETTFRRRLNNLLFIHRPKRRCRGAGLQLRDPDSDGLFFIQMAQTGQLYPVPSSSRRNPSAE